jgi:macrodomain Ter protein organizer (MatP/YcbG family)
MTASTTRLSIDMESKDHRKLKILADAHGMTLKELILTLLEPLLYPNKKPNKETLKAMEQADKGIGLKTFESVEHMWKELGLDK